MRASNPPQPVPESDTDAAFLTDNNAGAAISAAPPRTVEEMNHTVLRRYLPSLQHIVAKAPFAVLYTFSPDSGAWEKVGCEGGLFVCQLAAGSAGAGHGARFKLIILNRKGMDNFTTELISADDVEVTDEYVILQSTTAAGEPVIHGIWIFDDVDEHGQKTGRREMVCREIVAAAMRAQIAREEEGVAQQVGRGQSLNVMDLFGSSSRPQQERQSPPPPAETRFTPMADTDFFRTTGTAPVAQPYQQQYQQQQHQQRAPPAQQNILLDLFKR